MGRRSVARVPTPEQARLAIKRHFLHLAGTGGINLAEYKAQIFEEQCIDGLMAMAADVSGNTPQALRRLCYLDVLAYARGKPREWLHDGVTIDPNAMLPDGQTTVGEAIEKAGKLVDVETELHTLVAKRVPPDQWPPDIRQAVGEAISFYLPEAEEYSSASSSSDDE